MNMASLVAGMCGLHRLHPDAGIFAALLALPAAWGLHWLGGFPLLAAMTAAGAALTLWAAPRTDTPMMLDRVVGQWLALWPLSGGLWAAGAAPFLFPWPGWIGGFLVCQALTLFCGPIRRLSTRGPLWDDLAAGAGAGVLILIGAAIAHGWLM
ncbi:phosphatidylglycerophosphatase A [Pikeienuella sp. HZG-20]|uniref:phosphatidylglycerophosphatase A n=1 Tax=Paludibacillus litoralis TaxID=3133267 RepID=UPI0030EB7E95